MKRADALAAIHFAGYHQDHAALTRLYVENRIGYAAAKTAFRAGARARAAGVMCGCSDCATTKQGTIENV